MPQNSPHPLTTYFALRTKIDALCATLHAAQASAQACAPGCADCCGKLLRFSAIEIHAMACEVRAWPTARRAVLLAHLAHYAQEKRRRPCPLLKDSLCLAYESRPLLCRSHGLLLALDEPPGCGAVLSTCPKNYQAPYPAAWAASALSQARLGTLLYHANGLFCRQAGISETRRLSPLSLRRLLRA